MYPNNRRPVPSNQKPRRLTSPKGLFLVAAIIIAAIVAGGWLLMQGRNQTAPNDDKTETQAESFDKTLYSLDDPASLWLVVNKRRPLNPIDYQPSNLTTPNMSVESDAHKVNAQTAAALAELAAAALNDGIELTVASAYRSYPDQDAIYKSVVNGYGQQEADRISARPGHSEHQTGWTADLSAPSGECRLETCFGAMAEGKWLAANAHKFGFIIRYPEGKEHITGYSYEPWHLRYVGEELAAEMHRTSTTTLEEFFDLPPAPNY